MSIRELVVLGTSSQVPTRYRAHNGLWLTWDGDGLLVDPGEGTQRQMLLAGLRASSIRHICVTHFHGDHCLGLAGVTQRISLDRVPHEVPVHFPASGQVYFERLRHASIFDDHARLSPRPIRESGTFVGPSYTLEARRLDHGVDAFGYRVVEPDGWTMVPERLAARGVRGPAVGRLLREGAVVADGGEVRIEEVAIHRKGQVVAFVMDTRLCDAAFELAAGADLLVCESTYLATEAVEARDHGHLTADQAGRIAAEAGARSLVLTHFSQRYPLDAPFEHEARRRFDGPVVAARDLMRVPVPPRRTA
jgi:ribonuclease Z